jgi:branched-chain amino acid aminotransferase
MALFQAYERGGETALLVDAGGNIAEGPGFNVFAVYRQGSRSVITTPDRGVLEGISRRTMIELGSQLGHDVKVQTLSMAQLRAADAIFLSTTGGGAIAVSHLDGQLIAGRPAGQFGLITQQLQQAYWDLHKLPAYSDPVAYDLVT